MVACPTVTRLVSLRSPGRALVRSCTQGAHTSAGTPCTAPTLADAQQMQASALMLALYSWTADASRAQLAPSTRMAKRLLILIKLPKRLNYIFAPACQTCWEGTYADRPGLSSCLACPLGTFGSM